MISVARDILMLSFYLYGINFRDMVEVNFKKGYRILHPCHTKDDRLAIRKVFDVVATDKFLEELRREALGDSIVNDRFQLILSIGL